MAEQRIVRGPARHQHHRSGHGDYSPDFTTRLAAEATALIVAAGEDAGLNMDVTAAAGARFARATALGHGGDDMAAAFFASFGRVL